MLMRHAAITVALVMASPFGFATTTTATQTQGGVAPAASAPPAQPAVANQNTPVNAVPVTTNPSITNQQTTPTQNTPPSLRQNQGTAAPLPPTLASLQQKHNQEMATQQKRLALLEEANQEALAKNQQLQISNDSLAGQVQVLQSERSAQMFLYGAVTFGLGILFGIIIHSVLTSRRRRSW